MLLFNSISCIMTIRLLVPQFCILQTYLIFVSGYIHMVNTEIRYDSMRATDENRMFSST